MVANTRCAEIRDDQFSGLRDDPSWETLQTESKAGLVDDFGKRAWDLMDSCFTGYAAPILKIGICFDPLVYVYTKCISTGNYSCLKGCFEIDRHVEHCGVTAQYSSGDSISYMLQV